MEYVAWEVFVWAIGLTVIFYGIMWNQVLSKEKDLTRVDAYQDEELKELKDRTKSLECCYNDFRVVISEVKTKMISVEDKLGELKDLLTKK